MRLAFFVHKFYPSIGGTQLLTYELSRRLSKLGYNVEVYTSLTENTEFYESLEGINIFRFPRIQLPLITYPWCLTPSMIKILASDSMKHYDVIHSFGYITFQSLLASLIKMRFRIPLVITAQYHPWNGLYPKMLGKRILRLADIVIAQCSWEREKLELITSREKIITIPVGIDKTEFEHLPSRNMLREELHIPDDTIIMLYIGAVTGHKRISDFIKLFSRYLLKLNTTFLILGKDAHKLKFHRLTRLLEKKRKIIIMSSPSRRDILKAYAAADIYINTSQHESFGISILEAAASGLPIVSTNTGIALDIVSNGFNGYLCPADDIREIVPATIKALKNIHGLLKNAKIMRRSILMKYDWHKVIGKYIKVYNEVYNI